MILSMLITNKTRFIVLRCRRGSMAPLTLVVEGSEAEEEEEDKEERGVGAPPLVVVSFSLSSQRALCGRD